MAAPQLVIDTSRRLAGGLSALAAVLALVTALSDPAGRLLTGPAALAALLMAGFELRGGPVLRADPEQVEIRQGWRRVRTSWTSVERMRVVKDRRTELLELDLGDTTVLLSRTRLGRLPDEVLTELLALRSGDAGVSRSACPYG
ncbi:MAG: PH domain-containing protein [Mycobacteriales bacterium]